MSGLNSGYIIIVDSWYVIIEGKFSHPLSGSFNVYVASLTNVLELAVYLFTLWDCLVVFFMQQRLSGL